MAVGALALGCSNEAYFSLLPPSGAGGGEPSSTGGVQGVGGGGPTASGGAGGAGGGAVQTALIHRYDFSGNGTELIDTVGDQHGELRGGVALLGEGSLQLDGVDDYVALPSRLISSLQSVTLAAWLQWDGTPARCWQRIFDFGNNDAALQGDAGNVTSALFVTPSNCPQNALTAQLDFADGGQSVRATQALPADEPTFVALVFSNVEERFELYLDGEMVGGEETRPGRLLSEIDDVNNWLGRSQWVQDQIVFLRARYDEFRIYDRALSADEVRLLGERGPNLP